jgi:hypothetical protein
MITKIIVLLQQTLSPHLETQLPFFPLTTNPTNQFLPRKIESAKMLIPRKRKIILNRQMKK